MFYFIALLTTREAKFPECHGLPRVPKKMAFPKCAIFGTRGRPLPRKLFPECLRHSGKPVAPVVTHTERSVQGTGGMAYHGQHLALLVPRGKAIYIA
jgi:hypothetical protein